MFQQPFVAGPVLPEVVQIDPNSSLLNNKVRGSVEGSFALNPQRAECAASLPLFVPSSSICCSRQSLAPLIVLFSAAAGSWKKPCTAPDSTHCRRLVAGERTGESSSCTSQIPPSGIRGLNRGLRQGVLESSDRDTHGRK